MPNYDYRCETCGNISQVFQSFADSSLTSLYCNDCETDREVKKFMGMPNLILKGSHFARNTAVRSKPDPGPRSYNSYEAGIPTDSRGMPYLNKDLLPMGQKEYDQNRTAIAERKRKVNSQEN